jgi:hypothetical protein
MTSILKVDTIQDTAGNNIINESSDTITIGASGDTVNIVGTLQNNGSGLVSGITEADQWRITADHTITNSETDITTNWERVDTDGFNYIGTGMTESSGIFSFPSTGIYLITFNTFISHSTTENTLIKIKTTINNSTYDEATQIRGSASNGYVDGRQGNFIFDVTSTANCKVKFSALCGSSGNQSLKGDTGYNASYATFTRLGDT